LEESFISSLSRCKASPEEQAQPYFLDWTSITNQWELGSEAAVEEVDPDIFCEEHFEENKIMALESVRYNSEI
jgi:hypothetical protein